MSLFWAIFAPIHEWSQQANAQKINLVWLKFDAKMYIFMYDLISDLIMHKYKFVI